MKTLKLKANSSHKLLKYERELSAKDVEEVPKSITPGEWVVITDELTRRKYLAYLNPHSEIFHHIKIIKHFPIEWKESVADDLFLESVIEEVINKALYKRSLFSTYDNGSRLIYGSSDGIPGLIVDKYKKYILIQINTAGLDKYRNKIKEVFSKAFPDQKAILFDNVEYRRFEVLPTYEMETIDEDLEVEENEILYKVKKESIQKIGFYYDHRENRKKMMEKIKTMRVKKETGLDLFSYVGSWGLHLLKAGVQHVDFVDQGDMQKSVEVNLELNKLNGRGTFVRKDVFKYLDEVNATGKRFDIIVSDPPAFTKSEKNKITAVQGYEKLHHKALKLLNDQGLFIAASCTHYVDMMELDKTVQDAAHRNNQRVQLLDVGVQGHDHPTTGFKDKSFYIKYLLYFVERG